jgi:hypothetical protein
MVIADPDGGEPTTWTCSAPAAIIASGPATVCHMPTPTAFFPAGRRFSVTCAWTGSTISVSPRVACSAAFSPLGGE